MSPISEEDEQPTTHAPVSGELRSPEASARALAQAREAALERIAARAQAAKSRDWYGARTLFLREFKRFWNIAGQTVVSPVVTTMLYFLVFGYSLGDRLREIDGVPYIDFLVPGLVMLALINNAYINAAFSLFITKIQGTIVDILVTPLSPAEMMFGYTAASIVRAVLIGGTIWGVAMLMGAKAIYSLPVILLFTVMTAMAFAFVGLLVAILARDFDHVNLLPSFLITPLTFLGGVFYSIEMLPAPWDTVSRFNPILYMVNGLRYGMTGVSDVPYWQGALVLLALNLIIGGVVYTMLKRGRLRT